MPTLIILENPKNWNLAIPGVEVVAAREYLSNSRFGEARRTKVFNMCRRFGYQTLGYYVSLLAEARGHKPLPSVSTLQDLRLSPMTRIVSEEIDNVLQKSLSSFALQGLAINIYFGRTPDSRLDRLAQAVYNYFPSPLLRAEFAQASRWRVENVRPIATSEIPDQDRPFVAEQALRYFQRKSDPEAQITPARYDLAILVNPEEKDPPSDEKALQRFVKAARTLGMDARVIGKEDIGHLAEFDGLFIRETTYVNHHTYRIARRAEAEGLVVIDNPESILRCTNKVFEAEMFARHNVPSPRTVIVHRENLERAVAELGLPVVLKRPDSSFSLGVVKANDKEELTRHLTEFLKSSELVVAQEFVASDFDWRIGVLESKPLYACKYYMAPGHWQIVAVVSEKERVYGRVESVPLEAVPKLALEAALKAAKHIGDGLYGVDLKQVNGRFLVMEVNDNPTIEAGDEDALLKDELYLAIMRTFLTRLESRGVKGPAS
jgi:glutathione synthase/RimK-type ligase-like ATP-grasp enzyme